MENPKAWNIGWIEILDTSNRKIESIQYSVHKILDVSNLRYGDAAGKSRIEGNNETTKFGRENV